MASLIQKVKKDIQVKVNLLFTNKYKKLGFSWADVKKTRVLSGPQIHNQQLLGEKIFFRNGQELMHGIDEIFLEEVYKIPLPPNAFIIDCGAHIGLSVIYLKTKFHNANIIAFEPDKINFNLLQQNVSSFKLGNVELRNEAVWKENAILSFASDGNMSSKINDITTSNTISIKAVRLFDIINKRVDFLKLDVEGAEYEILIDIESKLNFISCMFIEYHGSFSEGYKLSRILKLLDTNGFKFYIKEANPVYPHPFSRDLNTFDYDIQLNIFCFK